MVGVGCVGGGGGGVFIVGVLLQVDPKNLTVKLGYYWVGKG